MLQLYSVKKQLQPINVDAIGLGVHLSQKSIDANVISTTDITLHGVRNSTVKETATHHIERPKHRVVKI
jgi:hypothetical protein